MKKKRIFAGLSLIIILFSFCLPVTAHAESEMYWKLTDTYERITTDDYDEYNSQLTGSNGQYTLVLTMPEEECSSYFHGSYGHIHSNEVFTGTYSVSAPESIYRCDDVVSFDLNVTADTNGIFCNNIFCDLFAFASVPYSPADLERYGDDPHPLGRIQKEFFTPGEYSPAKTGVTDERGFGGKHCEDQRPYATDESVSRVMYEWDLEYLKEWASEEGPIKMFFDFELTGNVGIEVHYMLEYTLVAGSEETALPSVGHETTTDADNTPGEMNIAIPAAVGAVLVGGGLIALKSGKKKKLQKKAEPKEERSKEKQEEKKEEQNEKKRYEMRVYKDFGDTLYVGRSVTVSARIVEITPDGREQDCPELTAKLRISSREYLEVSGETLRGRYMTAQVKAPGGKAVPQRAAVSFAIISGSGSFTNNLWFNIAGQKIVFAQEELLLPAKYDKPVRLPFGVGGATAASVVTAVIEPAGVYDVTVEPGENPEVFYAVITEREGLSRAEKSAGEHEDYTLHIKARLAADDDSELMGSLPVCRFFMGLCVNLKRNYVGCYVEPKEHRRGIERSKLKAGDMQPSVTQIHTALFTWDEEEHTLLCIPVVPSAFEIVPEDESDAAAREHIGKMQIACVMEKVTQFKDYSFAEGAISCTAAVLDAPLRHKAMLRIRAEHDGKTYTYEDKLALLSQPYREMGADNLAVYRREDAKLLQNLQRIRQIIDRDGYYQNLFPLYKLIDVMLDAYKVEFGFDPHQYELCRDVFDRFMRGDLLGANAKPEVVTLADEMYMFITATLDKAVEVEDSIGFMSRMALGVATLGMADATFTGMRVLKEMKDYAENGGDSVLEGFYVGAKLVTAEYITDKLMGKAVDFGSKGLKKVAEIPSVQKSLEKARDSAADTVKKVTGFDITAKARRGAQRMQDSRSAKASARAQGGQALDNSRAGLSSENAGLEKAYRDGLDIGEQKVKDLRASYELMKMNPTPENIELFRQITKQVQANEYAMYEMMKRTDMPEVCAAFNRQLDVTYQAADRQAREMLARKYQVSVEDVEVFSASSKDKADLLSGKKVTKDRDVTLKINGEYIPQDEAEQVYQQSFRDNLNGGRVDRDYSKADPYVKTDLRELDAKLDRQAGKRYDQAVVQKTSMENYGNEDDLRRMVNPDYHGEALDDSLRVSNTVRYKGQEWLKQGYAAAEDGDFVTALAKRKEGMRQTLKQFKIADGRNTARFVENGSSKISGELRAQMAVVERCIEDNSISPSAVDSTLSAMGTTFEEVLDRVAGLFIAIG